ncbi:BLUF domain-containing protein [Sphingomonas sp. 8AM]|uniref:BLUF domain-containing protein n=1 Tax=Sphingomonas sp. 8AM TaxID=2653170 RepID=UPI0012F02B11|nr:conserved hypothetical protein [Sphingomonas sp. 8AM]
MCEAAAVRNEVNGITGLFLSDGSRFLQVIEGEGEDLDDLMRRIVRNPRHHDIIIVSSHRIEHREFHNRTMSQPLYGVGDDPDDYVERIKEELREVSDDHLKAMFIGFAYLARNARFRYE